VRKSDNYGDAEFLEHLPRLIDLVPTRGITVFLLFAAGIGVVAGIVGLFVWMPQSVVAVNGRVEAFDLAGPANLATWFSSMVLAAAGCMAIIVHSVRRYRTDDYHGHYRVWIWAALCCFLLSVDQTANLRDPVKVLATRLSGTPLYGDGSAWWMIVYGFFLGAIGTRLLVDMLACRLSAATLVAAVACYGLTAACRFGWVHVEAGPQQVMVAEGARMLGNFLILLAIAVYGRHVILDAEGLLARKKKEPAKAPEPDNQTAEPASDETGSVQSSPVLTGSGSGQTLIVHLPHSVPPPAGSALVSGSAPTSSPCAGTAQSPPAVQRKLTKAERKALRQRLEQLRQQRERRAG